MATVGELRVVLTVLAELAGDVELDGVSMRRDEASGVLRVELVTTEPGRMIGRRGSTADAIRDALAVRLGVPDVQVGILERQDSPPPRWPPY